jgi:hypothetical protein
MYFSQSEPKIMSAGNSDIRQQVNANRDALKKLQLLVPGLSGYRKREDIRIADELLRSQVADKLDQAKANLEAIRKQMATANDFTNLTSIGSLISQMQQVSGEIRHAQQGYSGFAAPISIDETKLNALYNYDYDFVSSSMSLLESVTNLVYDPSSPASVQPAIAGISKNVANLKQKWAARMQTIENILAK